MLELLKIAEFLVHIFISFSFVTLTLTESVLFSNLIFKITGVFLPGFKCQTLSVIFERSSLVKLGFFNLSWFLIAKDISESL